MIAGSGIVLAVLGFLYTGDYPKLAAFSNLPGLGYALVDVGLGAVAVFILIDSLLLRQRRIDQQKDAKFWEKVGSRVNELLKGELMGIVADVTLATNASPVISAPIDATSDQLAALEKEATLKVMERMASDIDFLKENVQQAAMNILNGEFGNLFSERAKRLGDLQMRYWSRFLSPVQVSMLIDLEQLLSNLDTHIAIVKKDRQRARETKPAELAHKLSSIYVDEVYKDLQNILKLLVNGIHEGSIEMP